MNECHNKSNERAQKLLHNGDEAYIVGNYRAAMQKYNDSLCYTKPNSLWESLAYKHREKCFLQMNMYGKALTDVQWALKYNNHTGRTMLQLKTQLVECQKKLVTIEYIERPMPKINFSLDRNFPCLADVLEIRENKQFGRHLVTKCDIGVGKVVMVSDIYASAATSDTLTICRVCTNTEENFIACTECPNAMFCRGKCSIQTSVHRWECNTIFHTLDSVLKLPIQTILMAIDMFQSIEHLMSFVERYVQNGNGCGVPKAARDAKSKYALFLTLTRSISSECIFLAYQAYSTMMTFPQIKRIMNTEKERRFLAHLTLHHVTVIARNSFEHYTHDSGTIKTSYIYDVLSLINHLCSPNLFNVSKPDDVAHCITVKPILAGEQVQSTKNK